MKKVLVFFVFVLSINFSLSQGMFVENKGQLIDFNGEKHQEILFYKKGKVLDVYFTQKGLSYYFKKSNFIAKQDFKNVEEEVKYNEKFLKDSTFFFRLDMIFSNANSNMEVAVEGKQNHYNNYYYPHTSNGLLEVPIFQKVIYKNVYNNIDFEFYFVGNQLKYDIVLKANAEISDIKLFFDGAENIKIKENELLINSPVGLIKEVLPRSFTESSGKIEEKEVKYLLKNNEVSFKLDYDNSSKLVIDPQITWSTYFDGTDLGQAEYIDVRGNQFVATYGSYATNLPALNPGGGAYFQNSNAGNNDFVILKFDTSGVMQWSTHYGGTSYDAGRDIAIASNGDIVVTGYSQSTDIPKQNPGGGAYYDGTYTQGSGPFGGGGYNLYACFIIKFNSLGVRSWATHYDFVEFPILTLDNNDNLYIIGRSEYDNPPVLALAGAYNQSTVALDGSSSNSSDDMFIIKFNSNNQRVWATNLGGDSDDFPLGVTTDNSNNLYIIGAGDNYYGTNAGFVNYNPGGGAYYDNMLGTGTGGSSSDRYDMLLYKFNPTGAMVWGTAFGGNLNENNAMGDIAVDNSGNVFILGGTRSSDLPVVNPGGGAYYDGTQNITGNGYFLARFNSSLQLNWCTYYGGIGSGTLRGGLTTTTNNKLISVINTGGGAASFPMVNRSGDYNQTPYGGNDLHISEFNTTLSLDWATYLGSTGTASEWLGGFDVTDNNSYSLFVTGRGWGTLGYPLVNPGGGAYFDNIDSTNAFITKLSSVICDTITNTTSTTSICETGTKTLVSTPVGGVWSIVSGGGTISGTTYTPANVAVNTPVTIKYKIAVNGSCPADSTNVTFTVNVNEIASNTTSTAAICETGTKALTASPGGGVWSVVSGGGSISGTTYTPANIAANTSVTVRYTIAANGGCAATTSDRTFTVNVNEVANNTTTTTSICETATKALTGTPAGGAWSIVSGGGSISGTTYTPANITANTSVTIKYKTLGSGSCPADSANVTFTVEPTITPSITSSAADMCNGDTRALTGTPSGGTWSVVSGPGSITGTTLTATGSGTIQVRYRIVNACGNNDATQNITVSNSIAVSAVASASSLCENLTRTMSGIPSGGAWNVLNGPGTITGGVLTPSGLGTVEIEYAVTSSCGNGADTIDVVINPVPNASAGVDENICTGDTVILTATGGGTYQWNPGSAGANNQVYPSVTTGYRVDVTSDSGCVASDSVTVFVQSTGVATAQNDQATVTTGIQETIDIYSNDVGGINSLQLLNGPSHGTASISGGNIIYTSTAGYIGIDSIFYEICDANCGVVCDTAYLVITVENDLTIPIGISPNGDGKNDVFNILGLSKYSTNHLYIYNRWGSLVYEAQPYLNDWSGESKNGELIEGTYFYVLKLGEELPSYNGYIELKK